MASESVLDSPVNEILDFLLSQPSPEQIIELRASESAQQRLRYLLDGNRNQKLNDSERVELDSYIQLDNLVSRLKARARVKLASQLV
jgi:hypothetical protein